MDWELLPTKVALVSVIWVQWKKVATSGHWQCIISVEKGSFSNYKLNVYVVGSIPTSQAILFCGSPRWLGQNITEPCLF
jgi:hypothetical protein